MKSIAVIGLDHFGITLSETLSGLGHQVLCIDKNEDSIEAISEKITNAVCTNYTSEQALRAADIRSYDCAVICISDSMEDSLLCVLSVMELGISSITVRAISEEHKKILSKLGISDIIYPEYDMANKLAYRLAKSKIKEYLEFSGEYSIIEVAVPQKWVGKALKDLKIRTEYGINIIAISSPVNHSFDITVDPLKPLESTDILVALGADETLIEFAKNID